MLEFSMWKDCSHALIASLSEYFDERLN